MLPSAMDWFPRPKETQDFRAAMAKAKAHTYDAVPTGPSIELSNRGR